MGIIQEFFAKIGDAIDAFLGKFTDSVVIKSMIKVGAVFLLIIVIIIMFASCGRKKTYKPEEFLTRMVAMTKAKRKYKAEDKNNELPKNDKDVVVVPLESFVEDKTIKDLDTVIDSSSTCTGEIKIINNNGYYLFIPKLDCGDVYKTTTLYDTLVKDENIVTEGNGLYSMGDDYVFRGDSVNNFLKIGDTLYRIIRVNGDGTIRAIDTTKRTTTVWDNRYNIEKKSNNGINNYYANGINSRVKDYIENLYDNVFTEDVKPYFTTHEICIGKRSVNDDIFDTSIECSEKIDNYPLSLVYPYEYYLVSLDQNCTGYRNVSCVNYNYFNTLGSIWTITADKDTTHYVYRIDSSGADLVKGSLRTQAKVVVHLNGELIVEKGIGSEEDPYIIKTFTSTKKR